MVSVGVLYLLFEKSLLSVTKSSSSTINTLSKSILGVQIGLIVLAMIVTQSSIGSLQAKHGLPIGNQVVGWVILSMTFLRLQKFLQPLTTNSNITHRTVPPRSSAKQPLSPSPCYNIPDLFPSFYNFNHILRRLVLSRLLRYPPYMGPPGTSHLLLSYISRTITCNTNTHSKASLHRSPSHLFPAPIHHRKSFHAIKSLSPPRPRRLPPSSLLSLPPTVRLFFNRKHCLYFLLLSRLRLPPHPHLQPFLPRRPSPTQTPHPVRRHQRQPRHPQSPIRRRAEQPIYGRHGHLRRHDYELFLDGTRRRQLAGHRHQHKPFRHRQSPLCFCRRAGISERGFCQRG